MEDQRAKWRDELETGFRKHKDVMHGNRKTRKLRAKDFPQMVDGIMFQTLAEYHEFVTDGGRDFMEMAGTDKLYEEWEKVAGSDRYKQKDLFNGHSIEHFYSSSSYTPAPPKPEYKLEKNYYAVIGEVEHMRYIVYRDMEGEYFALWISLGAEDTLDVVMETVSGLKLAEGYKFPAQLPNLESNMYVRGGYKKYSKAEDNFYRGVETVYKVKERIKKAKDPNWIPPNLRQMALAAFEFPSVWSKIPTEEHPRLKAWLNDGAPGWYKKTPPGLYRGCMERRESKQKLLPPVKDNKVMGKLRKFSEMLGQTWDSKLQRWVPIHKGKPN